jgi:hypothetical protein
MRSFTALTLLLALIGVLDSEAKGMIGKVKVKVKVKGSPLESQARKLCDGKDKKGKDRDEGDDVEKRTGDSPARKAPKGSRKLKSGCTSVVSQATTPPTPPTTAGLATGNGCDKQVSITAALAIIAGSIIWFAM